MMTRRKSKSKPECMHPQCDQPVRSRGLCYACYQTASRLVKDETNDVTWETLEDTGKANPPTRRRRSPKIKSWFTDVEV